MLTMEAGRQRNLLQMLQVVGNCMGSAEKEDAIKAAVFKTDQGFLDLVMPNGATFSPSSAISCPS